RVETRLDAEVPVDALWRTLAALDRAEEGWAGNADSKLFTLSAAPQPRGSNDGDENPGPIDPKALALKPGTDAFKSFAVQGRLRVQLAGADSPAAPQQVEPERVEPE